MTRVQELGRTLRTQRLAAGLSQQAVCRSAGVARSWLSKVEAGGHGGAEMQKVLDLAAVLGLKLSLVPVTPVALVVPVDPVDQTDAVETTTAAPSPPGADPFEHLFD